MATGDDRTHIGKRLLCLEHCALHRRTITMTCPACRHVRKFDAIALWWLFERRGWSDALPAAWRRFKCGKCAADGRRMKPRVEITRDRPDENQLQYPDQSTWKRLVSRYRS